MLEGFVITIGAIFGSLTNTTKRLRRMALGDIFDWKSLQSLVYSTTALYYEGMTIK